MKKYQEPSSRYPYKGICVYCHNPFERKKPELCSNGLYLRYKDDVCIECHERRMPKIDTLGREKICLKRNTKP